MPKISELPAGTTPTGSEIIPAVQNGTTVELTVRQIRGFISVTDSAGVDSTGATDSFLGLTAAITAAATQGKALFWPAGTYLVSAALTPATGSKWVGEGYATTIIKTSSATANIVNITNSFFTLEDIQFQSSVTRSAGSFLNINATNVFVRKFMMTAPFTGITLGSSCSIVYIEDGVILNTVASTGVSIALNGGLNTYFNRLICTNASGAKPFSHVSVNNGGDYNFSDCGLLLATHNMYVGPASGATVATLRCDNVYFDQAGSNNLLILPSSTGVLFRSDFNQCWFTGSTVGVNISGTGSTAVDGVDFIDCFVFQNTTGIGIAGSTAKNINISNCQIAQNGTGVSLDLACTQIRIEGNKIGACSGYTANTIGILLTATAIDSVLIAGNDLSGSTTPISNSSSGTNNSITGNIGYKPMGELASGQIWVGQASNTALQAKTVSGDLTLAASGAGTLASVITGAGPIGTATAAPVITYDAKGRLTTVTTVTITPAIGSITGLGTGVATALAVNTGSAGAFITFNGNAGTPSALVGTNISGTAASLTAGNVTTNANLTGVITSVGNATSIASQTGTGTKFVMDTGPTLVGPVAETYTTTAGSGTNTALTVNAVRNTSSGTADTFQAFSAVATDQGSTNPTAFEAFKISASYNNANNTSAFNNVMHLIGSNGANVTAAEGLKIEFTTFSGTVGTWTPLHITAVNAGGGTVTTKQAILIDATAGPIIQNDTTDSTTVSTGAIQVAGGIGVAKSIVSGGLFATSAAAPTIASANTIAPTKLISFISGTTLLKTITAPSPISLGGGHITLIPTGLWSTDATGNIAIASTAVVSKALIMTYDVTTAKWYPSY